MTLADEITLRTEPIKLVAFRVGGQEYCVDILSVREIRGWSTTTAIPDAPDYVKGVINLRGNVLPVIDLACRLGLPQSEAPERSVNIIANVRDKLIGLQVEAVSDIVMVNPEDMQTPPDTGMDPSTAFVQNLVSYEDRLICYINLDHIFPEKESQQETEDAPAQEAEREKVES